MAVAYDAGTGGATAGGVSSLTFSHTTSGSDRALFVGVSGEWFGTTLTGITYSAVSMASLWNALFDTFYGHAGFQLAGPASGANNVVVSYGAAADVIRATAVSLTGVDQTTPCGTPVTTTGTSTSITVDAAGATDDIVVSHLAVMSNVGNNWSPASGTTRATSGSVGSQQSIAATYAGASTVTTTWNSDFTTNRCGLGSVAFKAATATAATLSAATPSGTLGTSTTATIGATTDQTSGTFYAVVDTAANLTGVTATQIKAGQKAGGSAALAADSNAVSTTSPTADITGLTAATLYSYAAVQNNANGDSNVVTGTFTTASGVTLTQSRYRWRNDDGSESAATWAAAENTPITLAKSTPRRLRIQVQSTNDKPSASYKLQYRKVGDPGWEDVN